MPLITNGGTLLTIGGGLATSTDCCCDEDCAIPVIPCDSYAANGVRGVAGTQPSVSISISGVTSKASYEPCTKNCEGCETYFNTFAAVLGPCTSLTDTAADQVLCENGGLLGGDANPIDAVVYCGYCVEPQGTETIAFVIVIIYTVGRGACGLGGDGRVFKFHRVVSNVETYVYEGASCTDTSTTFSYRSLLSGAFSSGWGGYTPATSGCVVVTPGTDGEGDLDSSDSRGCDFSTASVSVSFL